MKAENRVNFHWNGKKGHFVYSLSIYIINFNDEKVTSNVLDSQLRSTTIIWLWPIGMYVMLYIKFISHNSGVSILTEHQGLKKAISMMLTNVNKRYHVITSRECVVLFSYNLDEFFRRSITVYEICIHYKLLESK